MLGNGLIDVDDVLEEDYYSKESLPLCSYPIAVDEINRGEMARWVSLRSYSYDVAPVSAVPGLQFNDPPQELDDTLKNIAKVKDFRVPIENYSVSLLPENYDVSQVRFEIGKIWRPAYKGRYKKTLWVGETSGWEIKESLINSFEIGVSLVSGGLDFSGLSKTTFLLADSNPGDASKALQNVLVNLR